MARRKAGLTAGQLLTLTFGFTLASVIIFVFGIWVGRDLAQQRQERARPVARAQVEGGVPEKGAAMAPLPTATAKQVSTPLGQTAVERPTRPRLRTPTSAATHTAQPPRRTATRVPATKTRRAAKPTVAREARPTTAPREVWTVQAMATNDQVQALVSARNLRSKGFDAFTSQAEVAGATWYRIQVGKFAEKKEAEAMAARLRNEGVEAPFAERLR